MLFPWMKHNNLNWHQTIAQFMMSRRALWLLLAIMTGFVLITHQAVPMLDRDEARFSQASRQMAPGSHQEAHLKHLGALAAIWPQETTKRPI